MSVKAKQKSIFKPKNNFHEYSWNQNYIRICFNFNYNNESIHVSIDVQASSIRKKKKNLKLDRSKITSWTERKIPPVGKTSRCR